MRRAACMEWLNLALCFSWQIFILMSKVNIYCDLHLSIEQFMVNKVIIYFLLFGFCSGCATIMLNESMDEEEIPTELAGLYFDDRNLYVKYSAKLPSSKTYEKMGSLKNSALWGCAQIPSEDSGIPRTVLRKNVIFNIYEYNSELETCNPRWSRSDINNVEVDSLNYLPIKKVNAITKNDPSFDDEQRSYYAFSIKQEERNKENIYVLFVDRKLNRVLLMGGLRLPEDYIIYQSNTDKVVQTLLTVPAVSFDVITLPIQIAILFLVLESL